MDSFSCPACGQRVFFENVRCLACGARLAFDPSRRRIVRLEPAPDGPPNVPPRDVVYLADPAGDEASSVRVRQCANAVDHEVCNWTIPAADSDAFCRACRINLVIPNLGAPGARAAWARLESAKRRLLYTLLALKLPIVSRQEDPATGLGFVFKQDLPGEPVMTGHANGIITINLREADDAERERRRASLGEKYRTLVGHFRHESGHYYWLRFSRDERWRMEFRRFFGDERTDYAAALARHHAAGPPAGWSDTHISAYATAHPWEDWAETWAHYLHVTDTLETVHRHGLALASSSVEVTATPGDHDVPADSSRLLTRWMELTPVLNELNRGMGLPDLYPFALSPAARDKLAFVHRTIRSTVDRAPASAVLSA